MRTSAWLVILSAHLLVLGCERHGERQTAEDQRITLEVRKAVAGAQVASGRPEQVQVSTHQGVVQLLGLVGSGSEKAVIGALAQQVEGVRRIDNQLEILPQR